MKVELESFTDHLTGLESVTAVGWPFHGSIITSQTFDANNPPSLRATESTTIGQPKAGFGLNMTMQASHYAIRQSNAPVGWEYWLMHGYPDQYYSYVGNTLERIAGDRIGVFSKNPERKNVNINQVFMSMGAPLKTENGVVNISCAAMNEAGSIVILIHSEGGFESVKKTYPVNPVSGVYYAHGASENNSFGLRTFEEINSMPSSERIYTVRTHGFYENKMLVSVGVDLWNAPSHTGPGYITPQPIIWQVNPSARDERVDHSPEEQWQPFIFLEIIVNGPGPEGIELNVVHDWRQTAGSIERTEGPECGLETGVCVLESSQINCVLDVFYDDYGEIKTVYGDFIFRSESGKGSTSRDWYNEVDYTLRHRLGAEQRELEYRLEFVSERKTMETEVSHLEMINGDIIFEYEYAGRAPIFRDKNYLFSRAPFAGSEIRCITMPFFPYEYYDEAEETYKLWVPPINTLRSVTGRNCVALYASRDSVDPDLALPVEEHENTKSVTCWSICHRLGFSDMNDFSVEIIDDGPGSADRILLRPLPYGYTGRRVLTPANPVTGVIELPPINRPQSWVHYL